MNDLHLFTMKEYITRFHLACKELEATVDEWIAENNIQDLVKTEYEEHRPIWATVNPNDHLQRLIGFESASYGFYNELDALMFKMVFAEDFDYSVIDQD